MVDKKEVKKEVKGYKITKKNGKVIFRDSTFNEGRIKHHKSIGSKVEEV